MTPTPPELVIRQVARPMILSWLPVWLGSLLFSMSFALLLTVCACLLVLLVRGDFTAADTGTAPAEPLFGLDPSLVLTVYVAFTAMVAWRVRRWRETHSPEARFYADRIALRRELVRGEDKPRERSLSYTDIGRVSHVDKTAIGIGYGLTTQGEDGFLRLEVHPMQADDYFDGVLQQMSDHAVGHLYSIVEDQRISYSRRWSLGERFPHTMQVGSASASYIDRSRLSFEILVGTERTRKEYSYDGVTGVVRDVGSDEVTMQFKVAQVVATDGLILASFTGAGPGRVLMQFGSGESMDFPPGLGEVLCHGETVATLSGDLALGERGESGDPVVRLDCVKPMPDVIAALLVLVPLVRAASSRERR